MSRQLHCGITVSKSTLERHADLYNLYIRHGCWYARSCTGLGYILHIAQSTSLTIP